MQELLHPHKEINPIRGNRTKKESTKVEEEKYEARKVVLCAQTLLISGKVGKIYGPL